MPSSAPPIAAFSPARVSEPSITNVTARPADRSAAACSVGESVGAAISPSSDPTVATFPRSRDTATAVADPPNASSATTTSVTRRGTVVRPRHANARRGRTTVPRRVTLVVVALLAFGGSATAVAVSRLRGNVATVGSLDGLIAAPTDSPTEQAAADRSAGRAVTFVMLGSDTRAGENAAIGGADDGMRADTTIVVHVSADRRRVDAVSIPRDSEARIPACHLDREQAGRMSRPRTDKFNAAFAIGGSTGDLGLAAACTLSTIAANTGLAVTDFAQVDFAGFQGMVDAIGGIRVCVPTAIKDYKGNTALDLAAGWHDLDGPQALDYVRARYITGSDGSDVQRITRQQKFIAAVLRKALSADVLTSPVSLARFLDAGTRSLTMSDGLKAELPGLAWRLRDVEPSAVTFVTVPWGP